MENIPQKSIKKAEEYWQKLGPGLVTGAADDDPSGIATYSQTGAQTGFRFLWLAAFTFPLMAVVQEMCARIGLVTGRGLAANIKNNYSIRVLYLSTLLLFAANVFNIGVDLGAMAKAAQLVLPKFNFFLLILIFTLGSLLLQIFTSYKTYARYLKYLALILLSYVAVAFLVDLNWKEVFKNSFIPSITFSRDSIILITAILGTTISPYLFFWQTSHEVEEKILHGASAGAPSREFLNGATDKEIKDMRIDVWFGMLISNIVMFFIVAACAATLNVHNITNINTAAQAAEALRPLAGEWAFLLFAIGVIGTGMLSVPILAGSASYAISEIFQWKEGLSKKLTEAYAFYGVLTVAMTVGFAVNLLRLDPIKALIYSAVANGLVAPIILFLIVRLSGKKELMGAHSNNLLTSMIGWITVAIMTASGIATLIFIFI